ncbi:MAG: four helix bundle protein [Desulfobacteraceae bacterium]|nr:MAG: four helix bundle protein [Desulfobacteraceae bacterium]
MSDDQCLIPKHGGYRKLKSFQVAQLIYDVTVRFVDRYIDKRSRTCDQMVQAARSGVQNIAEGSQASGTSKKTELKLTNVARASLEELRLDYEDFLRQRRLSIWKRDDPRRQNLIDRRCTTADEVAAWVKKEHDRGQSGPGGQSRSTTPKQTDRSAYPELAGNVALVLLTVACSLLDRQLASQAEAFKNEGGFTERLYRIRSESRKSKFIAPSTRSIKSTPSTENGKFSGTDFKHRTDRDHLKEKP